VKKIKDLPFFSLFVKGFIFIISLYVLLVLLHAKREWIEKFYQAFSTTNGLFVFVFLLILMLINVSLEAVKWKKLVESVESISFQQSLMAVFSGICAGLITPHSIGDYIGRIFFIKSNKRLESIGSVMFSRLAQMFITCLAGIVAACYFIWNIEMDNRILYLILISLISTLIIYGGWIYRMILLDKMKRIPYLDKVEVWFETIRNYSRILFYKILLLSGLRYVVFLTQFVCLLIFFDVQLPLALLITGCIFTFVLKSIVPTFLDLGVRELAAVFFFSHLGVNQQSVILASLSLWFFNLIIPSFIGLFCMFKIDR
jgi:uncharacterized membrane protein YbhN (UPF0104 family)